MITADGHPQTVGWSQSIAVPGRDDPLVVCGQINAELFREGRYSEREIKGIGDYLMTMVARSIETLLACEAKRENP